MIRIFCVILAELSTVLFKSALLEQAMKDSTKMSTTQMKTMEDVQQDMAAIQKEMGLIQAGYKKKKYDIGFGDQ